MATGVPGICRKHRCLRTGPDAQGKIIGPPCEASGTRMQVTGHRLRCWLCRTPKEAVVFRFAMPAAVARVACSPQSMERPLVLALLFFSVFAAVAVEAPADAAEGKQTGNPPSVSDGLVGREAPDIRLMDHSAKETSLSGLRGKVVVLNFNHPKGCKETCIPDFTLLSELQEKYRDRQFEVVSVLAGFNERTWSNVLSEQKITWKTTIPCRLFDDGEKPEELRKLELPPRDYVEKISDVYGIKRIAANVVVGRDGKVAGVFGPLVSSREDVERAIGRALGL